MKKLLAIAAILGFTFAAQVTFQVDLSQNPDVAAENEIALQADVFGWWPGVPMTDMGDGLYSLTVELEAGVYEYKFAGYEWTTTEFPDWSMTEADAGPCLSVYNCTGAGGECEVINRSVMVGTDELIIDPVCWTSCEACVEPVGGALANGGFEDGLNGWGGEHNASWAVDPTGALVYTSEDIFEAYEGTFGLKTWGRFDGAPLNVFSQTFAVDPATELSFTGFVFSHPDDFINGDNSAYLSLNWSNAAREDLGQDVSELFTNLSTPDVWTELNVTATAPEGATQVEVAINYNQIANADGSVYWDAANLTVLGGGLSIAGCMDEEALNYNPDATVDDGSCYYEGDFVNVTFNVDFSCEGADPDPFLAGGGTFGNPGDNPMTDPDGDGIYSVTVLMAPNTGTDYTFTNGACGDWSCKESIAGQDCATEPWSDRHIDVGEEDVVVNTCFAQCVDGTCGECPDPNTGDCLESQVAVTFYVDLSQSPDVAEAHTIALMGEFNGWWPGDIMDDLGDYVYSTTICLGADTDYEYKFAGYQWTISEFPDAMYPVDEPPCPGTTSTVECQYGTCTNRLLHTETENMVMDVVYWAGCETYTYVSTPDVTFGVDLSMFPEIAANNVIALQGNFAGWWPGIIMDDADGDLYYEVTVPLEAGQYQYKFAGYEWSTTEFEDWSFTQENAPPCLFVDNCTGDNGECQFINRIVDITETVELDGVYWGTCDIVPTVPEVTFQVDLSQNPDIAAAHTIALQGVFAGWWPGIIMDDSDGDLVYTVTLELEPGNYEYKFAGYEWTTTEFADWAYSEADAPECLAVSGCEDNGPCNYINRSVDVVDDVVLPEVCWASCDDCPDVEPTFVDVTFSVDMTFEDPSAGVYLAGGTIGSEDPAVPSMGWLMEDPDEDLIFTRTLSLLQGSHVGFKYRTQPSYGWEGNWENVPAECGEGTYTDRWVDVGMTNMILDTVCWASCTACDDVPPPTYMVTFQVDLSNNPDIEAANTIALQSDFGGWWPGYAMEDPDGDHIYSITVELDPGSYEYKFAGYEWSTTEFEDWSVIESEAGDCLFLANCTGENGECQFINRGVTVDADVTLPAVCWAECEECETCGDGDLSVPPDGNIDVLDIVAVVAVILGTSTLDWDFALCHADVNGDFSVDILDVVMIVDWILNRTDAGIDATEAALIQTDSGVTLSANGYVGGVQMVLTHSPDFKIQMTENAYLAEYATQDGRTTLVVLRPGSELFTSSGSFQIEEVLAASSSDYINISTVDAYNLLSNYPNPFNPSTNVHYILPAEGLVNLSVYDVLGRKTATLINDYKQAGSYSITWNGMDEAGNPAPTGIYFVSMQHAGGTVNQKMMLLK